MEIVAEESPKRDAFSLSTVILISGRSSSRLMLTSRAPGRVIRSYNKECIVVAMTAYSWEDISVEAEDAGVYNYIGYIRICG